MKLKERIVRKQLKAMGIDLSDPKNLTFKTIKDLIISSVPSLVKSKEMIEFLYCQIADLKNEFGD
jgi:hypothetical protein